MGEGDLPLGCEGGEVEDAVTWGGRAKEKLFEMNIRAILYPIRPRHSGAGSNRWPWGLKVPVACKHVDPAQIFSGLVQPHRSWL